MQLASKALFDLLEEKQVATGVPPCSNVKRAQLSFPQQQTSLSYLGTCSAEQLFIFGHDIFTMVMPAQTQGNTLSQFSMPLAQETQMHQLCCM